MILASATKSARFWLLFLGLAGGWLAAGAAEPSPGSGQPFLQNFLPRDYGGGPQGIEVTQDAQGILYMGTLGAVVEYDGTAWRKIRVGEGWCYGTQIDRATDTIFVGDDAILGCLKKTSGGERVFVSLVDQLPADARDFTVIDRTYAPPQGIFFVGRTELLRWRDGHFKAWKFSPANPLRGGWAAGSFYVQNAEVGLLRLENEVFVPASADPIFQMCCRETSSRTRTARCSWALCATA